MWPTLGRHNRLLSSFARPAEELCLVEGRKLLAEALAAGLRLEALLLSPRVADDPELAALAGACPGGVVPPEVLSRLADTRSTPDVLALLRRPAAPRLAEEGLFLVLDGVQDPGNVGALLRSALAFGAAGAILGEGAADPFGPKVVRASAGAVFRLPVERRRDWREAVRPGDVTLFAEAHAGVPPESAPLGTRVLLVLGSEGTGIRHRLDGAVPVHLPVAGPVESLNVAVAGGILLYLLGRRLSAARARW